jgi:hypothetical protein
MTLNVKSAVFVTFVLWVHAAAHKTPESVIQKGQRGPAWANV